MHTGISFLLFSRKSRLSKPGFGVFIWAGVRLLMIRGSVQQFGHKSFFPCQNLECSILDFHFRCEPIICSSSYDGNHRNARLDPVGACRSFRGLFLLASVKHGSRIYENLCIPSSVEELGVICFEWSLNKCISVSSDFHLVCIRKLSFLSASLLGRFCYTYSVFATS